MYLYVCICIRMHISICICICIRVCKYMYVCMYVYVYVHCKYIQTYTYATHQCLYVRMCMYVFAMHMCVFSYVFVYICNIHVCIYNMHIHVFTTYTYTHIAIDVPPAIMHTHTLWCNGQVSISQEPSLCVVLLKFYAYTYIHTSHTYEHTYKHSYIHNTRTQHVRMHSFVCVHRRGSALQPIPEGMRLGIVIRIATRIGNDRYRSLFKEFIWKET